MKNTVGYILTALLFFACTKQENLTTNVNTPGNIADAVAATSIPLNDLGSGKYLGYTGGLYPDGLNYPKGTYATDLLKICKNLSPLDTFGNPSSTQSAKISFISLGWSTGGHNMRALQDRTTGNDLTNPALLLASCNLGDGEARLNNIMNPNDPYWAYVATRLTEQNTSFRQVQIIYLESEDSIASVNFPGRPLLTKKKLQRCFRVFYQKFPNVKLVYLLARTATFGDHVHPFNTEPCPYYLGWACKWAIQDQINGVSGTEYKGANKVSPLITWGFYEWAAETPRITDGFKWTPELMKKDRLHANAIGRDTLATRFQNFLLTDKYAKAWYAK